MELYWKVIGIVLIALILGLNIEKQEQDLSVLLTLSVCCLGAVAIVSLLEPVIDFLRELAELSFIQEDILRCLLKCTGIAIVSEATAMICQNGGNGALGRLVQMMGSTIILYLSIPAMKALLRILQEILGIV